MKEIIKSIKGVMALAIAMTIMFGIIMVAANIQKNAAVAAVEVNAKTEITKIEAKIAEISKLESNYYLAETEAELANAEAELEAWKASRIEELENKKAVELENKNKKEKDLNRLNNYYRINAIIPIGISWTYVLICILKRK